MDASVVQPTIMRKEKFTDAMFVETVTFSMDRSDVADFTFRKVSNCENTRQL